MTHFYIKERMESPVNQIVDSLFLGNAKARTSHSYDMIVNCTCDIEFPSNYKGQCIRIPIADTDLESDSLILLAILEHKQVLEKINSFIKNKRPVLVHCLMGKQRSCAVVACYLIKYHNMTPQEAIGYIKLKRPIAFLGNVNFLFAIEKFYEKHKESKIYGYAIELEKQLPLDLKNKVISEDEYQEKISKIKKYIKYYEDTYLIKVETIGFSL
jgi:protein-tyrosine phosphatase